MGGCGNCSGCQQENCQECIFCKDMKKYGGKNRLRQRCSERVCITTPPTGRMLLANFRHNKTKNKNEPRIRGKRVIHRNQRCGKCEGCLRENCQKCNYCKDMKKYGGQNRLRQRCVERICTGLLPNQGFSPVRDQKVAVRRTRRLSVPTSKYEDCETVGICGDDHASDETGAYLDQIKINKQIVKRRKHKIDDQEINHHHLMTLLTAAISGICRYALPFDVKVHVAGQLQFNIDDASTSEKSFKIPIDECCLKEADSAQIKEGMIYDDIAGTYICYVCGQSVNCSPEVWNTAVDESLSQALYDDNQYMEGYQHSSYDESITGYLGKEHGNKSFNCFKCKSVFTRSDDLYQHVSECVDRLIDGSTIKEDYAMESSLDEYTTHDHKNEIIGTIQLCDIPSDNIMEVSQINTPSIELNFPVVNLGLDTTSTITHTNEIIENERTFTLPCNILLNGSQDEACNMGKNGTEHKSNDCALTATLTPDVTTNLSSKTDGREHSSGDKILIESFIHNTLNKTDKHVCSTCKLTFSNQNSLKVHLIECKVESEMSDCLMPVNVVQCSASKYDVETVVKLHHICSMCKTEFLTQNALTVHDCKNMDTVAKTHSYSKCFSDDVDISMQSQTSNSKSSVLGCKDITVDCLISKDSLSHMRNGTCKQESFQFSKCSKCKLLFSSRDSLHTHIQSCTADRYSVAGVTSNSVVNPSECQNCKVIFLRSTDIKDHKCKDIQYQMNESTSVHCFKCQSCFSDSEELKKHSSKCTSSPGDCDKTSHGDLTVFVCQLCKAIFLEYTELQAHKELNDGSVLCKFPGQQYCSYCKLLFKDSKEIGDHFENNDGITTCKFLSCEDKTLPENDNELPDYFVEYTEDKEETNVADFM